MARVALCGVLCLTVPFLPSCSLLSANERLVYDRQGIRIGIEDDPTVTRSDPPALNNHPADLTPKELETLLQVIQVTGWSGTLVGMLETPRPVPLFTPKELTTISGYLATALHEARPTERVFFSLPKPDVTYSEDRTEGSLFLRGRYLHIVVTDHSAFIRADTGGGEPKDIRDTKSMKLWIAGPAQAATVPDAEEPRWAPFETVHVSLHVKEVLALNRRTPPVRETREGIAPPTSAPPSSMSTGGQGTSQDDLQLQIRELTKSNLDLRERLNEQAKHMQTLTDEIEQLRLELGKAKSKK
jgi:hypothetical protein